MNRQSVVLWSVMLASVWAAVQTTLDRRAIEEATSIGRSPSEAERRRFHAMYRLTVARPPIDWIDVITAFHRVEIAVEKSARSGGRPFGQREARQALSEGSDGIDLLVEMTFHPLNTFVGVPSYEVLLIDAVGARLQPMRVDRFPRLGPRIETFGPILPTALDVSFAGGQPVLGGTLVVALGGTTLSPMGRYEVVVLDGATELARSVLDLAKMR